MDLSGNLNHQRERKYKIRYMGPHNWKLIRNGVEVKTFDLFEQFILVYNYVEISVYKRYKVSVVYTKLSPISEYTPWFTVIDRDVKTNIEVVFVTRQIESLEKFYKNKFLNLLDKIFQKCYNGGIEDV